MAIFKRRKNKNKNNSTNVSSGGMSINQGAMTVGAPAFSGSSPRINTSNVRRDIAPEEMGYEPTSFSYSGGGSLGTGSMNTAPQGGGLDPISSFLNLSSVYQSADPDTKENLLSRFYQEDYDGLSGYYNEIINKNRGDFGDYLKQTQEGLDYSLAGLEQDFAEDRLAADVKEAQSGTLFSTGRRERRQSMQDRYQRAGDTARSRAESGLRSAARDAEYQLGSDAMGDYNMRLGSTTFDAGGTRPTTRRRLTRAYNANNNFEGSIPGEWKRRASAKANSRLEGVYTGTQLPGFYLN